MNLWQQVQESLSCHADILKLYEKEGIPIDIRHWLAPWIETQVWELEPAAFLEGLERQLETLPFFTNDRLTRFQVSLKGEYATKPQVLVKKIQDCLNEEYRLIQEEDKRMAYLHSVPSPEMAGNGSNDLSTNPGQRIEQLKLHTDKTEEILRQLSHFKKEFQFCLDEDQKIKGIIQYQNNNHVPHGTFETTLEFHKLKGHKEDVHAKIRLIGQSIWSLNSKLESKLKEVVDGIGQVQREDLSREIRVWKYEQQRSFIGYPCTISFNGIQELSETVGEILWTIRHQAKRAGELKASLPILSQENKEDEFTRLFQEVTTLLQELAQMTFIIKHQSLPIVRTDTKFYLNQWKHPLTVASLIAEKLNPRMSPPQVRVTIINEKTLERIRSQGISEEDLHGVGELTDNVGCMESCHQSSPHFAAVFRHIRLKHLHASRRRGTSALELVTDEKLYLLCTSEFRVGEMDPFKVWTRSPPIVVTTHWSQDCRAWGTLLWDYGLSSVDRKSLEVPQSASWPQIMELLNTFFFNCVGVALSPEQSQCLSNKALRAGQKEMKTLDELCKDVMEGRRFSFWDWFYSSMKLIEKHFRKEWQAGHVIGFISKDDAENVLMNQKPGTFLLRFSDSTPGAISVAGIMTDGQVYSLNPFNTKELEKRCLADRINDLVQFLILYPETPKSIAFGEPPSSLSPQPIQKKPDYWKSNQITVIDSGQFWMTGLSGLLSPAGGEMDVDVDSIDKFIVDLLESNSTDLPTFDEEEFSRVLDTMELE